MTLSVEAQIPAALMAHLASLTTTPALETAWPDVPFPAGGGTKPDRYLEVTYFANGPMWRGLGDDPEPLQGLLQISVYWPADAGIIAPTDVAGQVKAHFAGLDLWSEGTRIKTTREPVVGSPMTADGKVNVPVTIYWNAFPQET